MCCFCDFSQPNRGESTRVLDPLNCSFTDYFTPFLQWSLQKGGSSFQGAISLKCVGLPGSCVKPVLSIAEWDGCVTMPMRLPPLQTQPRVPCLLLPVVEAQTWPELLPPSNNSVQSPMGERSRTDPRKSESTGRKRRDLAGGELPHECRWVSRCLGLSF